MQAAAVLAAEPGFSRWHEQIAAIGGCASPIHQVGCSLLCAATGEVLRSYTSDAEPGGRILLACGNRRASRCPACSELYREDVYHLIKSGLVGGKGVPGDVAGRPTLFVTLTAPSFGPVHQHLPDQTGRIPRCHPHGKTRCGRRHRPDDPELGQPLNPDLYDYVGAVIWNAMAPKLWARTATIIRRQLAAAGAVPQDRLHDHLTLSFGKVAEYQTRGLVHFHLIVRLDGPTQTEPPPQWASTETLERAVRDGATRALLRSPRCDAIGGHRVIRWGTQIDLRAVTGDEQPAEGQLSAIAVAGYIAGYATKGSEAAGTVDTSLCCRRCDGTGLRDCPECRASGQGEDPETLCARCGGARLVDCEECKATGCCRDLDRLPVLEHTGRMIRTCWELGQHPQLDALGFRRWAHMLGFGGHFSTKSRRYSTTLTALRNARRDYRTARLLERLGLPPDTPVIRRRHDDPTQAPDEIPDDTVVLINHWRYAGRGHSPGQAVWANVIAQDRLENRRLAAQAIRQQRELVEGAA
jgi:hypothetical protein